MPSCGSWSTTWAVPSLPPPLPKVLSNFTKMSENPNTTKRPVHEVRTSTRRRHRPDLQGSFRPRARVVEGAVVASAAVRVHAAAAFTALDATQRARGHRPRSSFCLPQRVSGEHQSMKGSQTFVFLFASIKWLNLHRQAREGSPLNSRWKRVNRDHKPAHVSDDKTGYCGEHVEKNKDMDTQKNRARNRTNGQYNVFVFANVCHT